MKHYWVYIHTNKLNGKKYVGITTKDTPMKRWREGKGYRKNQPKFYRAIQKYGWDGFDHEAAEVETEAQMLFMETFLILLWNSVENGYNLTYGGEHNIPSLETRERMSVALSKPIDQYTKDGEFIQSWGSTSDAVIATGIHGIVACLKGRRKLVGGFLWKYRGTK